MRCSVQGTYQAVARARPRAGGATVASAIDSARPSNRAAISPNIGAIAVHIVTNGALTGATDNIDGGQQLVSA